MKRISRLVCLLMTIVFVVMLIPVANAAAKITMKSGKVAPSTIYAGHTYNLKVAGVKVKFTTSNKKVATIGATTGKMKAVAPGKVKITAKNAKSGKAVASKTFTVLKRAKSVTADSEVYLGAVGDTTTLKATLSPGTSTDVIRFASADQTIATVGATSGKITAKKEGETTITVYAKATKATSNKNKNNKVATVKVFIGAYLERAYNTGAATIHLEFKGNSADGRKYAPADFTVTNKETSVVVSVKEVRLSKNEANETVMDLTLYNSLILGKTYTLKYGESVVEFTVEEDIPGQLVPENPTLSMWKKDDSAAANVSTVATLLNTYGNKMPVDPEKVSFQLIQAPGTSAPKISAAATDAEDEIRITLSETPGLQEGSYIYQVNYTTAVGKEEEKITLQALLVLNVVKMVEPGSETETSTVSFYEDTGEKTELLQSYTLEAGSKVPSYHVTRTKMRGIWTWFREDTGEQIAAPSIVPEYNIKAVVQWKRIKDQYSVTFVDDDGTVLKEETKYPYGTAAADIVKPADPTKKETAEYSSCTFAGWSPEIADVTEDVTYTATYTGTKRRFTVTFWDESKGYLLKGEYDYGTAVEDIVKPEDPADIKRSDGIYTFAGWIPEITEIKQSVSFSATYKLVTDSCTITWKNDDGSVIDTTTAKYGAVPTHADATKAATDEYTYTFAGWSPAPAKAAGDTAYTATYTSEKKSYTITWKNEDGSAIDTTTVKYGEVPTHEAVTKAATDEYTYTPGWDPEIAAVTGDATYTAKFTPVKNSYTITWKNDDGSVIDTTTVKYGEVPTHEAVTKAATDEYTYTFSGWSPEIAKVTKDATYKATYNSTVNKYTVTFTDEDGTELKAAKAYDYGTAAEKIEKPDNPTKAATDEYSYTFAGWSPAIADVTKDVTYKATYTEKRRYTVTFVDDDEKTVLKAATKYDDGTAVADIEKPDNPTKAATDEYSYTFAGWSPALAEVTEDVTYKATYTEKRRYTVTFLDDDEKTVLKAATKYDDGTAVADIEKPDNPTKTATAEYSYTFAGWSPALADVTEDVTYKATYKDTVNKCKVTFVDDDGKTVLKATTEYDYGTAAEKIGKPADPTKAATDEYSYTFAGWSPALAEVTEDVTYNATYTKKRRYTITFVDDDEKTVLKAATKYDDGTAMADIEKPADPTKAATDEYSYTFAGWSPALAKVTEDVTYTATYTEKPRYTITFLDDDEKTVLKAATKYDKGTAAADIEVPAISEVKTDDDGIKYRFVGWDPAITEVEENTTYVARYEVVYTITVYPYGFAGTYGAYEILLAPGKTIPLPTQPGEHPDYVGKYKWDGWTWSTKEGDLKINGDPMPEHDETVTGNWNSTSQTTSQTTVSSY